MSSNRSLFVIGAALLAGGIALVASNSSDARSSDAVSGFLASSTIRGNLTVEITLDPDAGAASSAWAGPIKKVDEVTLLDEWAILRKRDGITTGVLIVPREQIVYINVAD